MINLLYVIIPLLQCIFTFMMDFLLNCGRELELIQFKDDDTSELQNYNIFIWGIVLNAFNVFVLFSAYVIKFKVKIRFR